MPYYAIGTRCREADRARDQGANVGTLTICRAPTAEMARRAAIGEAMKQGLIVLGTEIVRSSDEPFHGPVGPEGPDEPDD